MDDKFFPAFFKDFFLVKFKLQNESPEPQIPPLTGDVPGKPSPQCPTAEAMFLLPTDLQSEEEYRVTDG